MKRPNAAVLHGYSIWAVLACAQPPVATHAHLICWLHTDPADHDTAVYRNWPRRCGMLSAYL